MAKGHYHEEVVSKDLLRRLEKVAPKHDVTVRRLSKDGDKTRVAISAAFPDLGAFWNEVRK